MSNGVTEIIEEVTTQLEIIESESGQVEVIAPENTSIEISFSGSLVSPDLDISTTTEIITIDSVDEDTNVSITENPPTTLEITTEATTLEITDRVLLSGSFDLSFNNLVTNPFTVDNRGRVGRGRAQPNYDLHVNGTLFSDIVSSSKNETNTLVSNTISSSLISSSQIETTDLFSNLISSPQIQTNELILDVNSNINSLSVNSGSNTPVTINPAGIIVLDNFQYTPPPVEGGLLYSGSSFYLGLVDS
jgi:hypothetical protein